MKSSVKHPKSVRQIKDRALVLRRDGNLSREKSLDMAAREHGFADFETARNEIERARNELLSVEGPQFHLARVPHPGLEARQQQ